MRPQSFTFKADFIKKEFVNPTDKDGLKALYSIIDCYIEKEESIKFELLGLKFKGSEDYKVELYRRMSEAGYYYTKDKYSGKFFYRTPVGIASGVKIKQEQIGDEVDFYSYVVINYEINTLLYGESEYS